MSILEYKIVKILLATMEIFFGFLAVRLLMVDNEKTRKIEKFVIVVFSLVLGVLLEFNRNYAFVSRPMLLFCILVITIIAWIIYRKKVLLTLGVVWTYCSLVTVLEIVLAFVFMVVLQNDFNMMIYTNATSELKEVIYLCSSCTMIVLGIIVKKVKKKYEIDIADYQKVLLISDVVLYGMFLKYHNILDDMALGAQEIQNAIIFTVIFLVFVSVFVGFVFLKYKIVENEYKALLLKDEISKRNYQELSEVLSKNAQLRHDMKHFILIIKEYAEENDVDSIKEFVDNIRQDYIDTKMKYWTGNNVLDIILNQKYMKGIQNKIDVSINASLVGNIYLSETEICALFGNLLDNALEATELVEQGWIKVNIKRQQNMLYFDIKNNFLVDPILKNGDFVTTKADKATHGYGLKSVKRIVEKYDGKLTYQIKEKTFRIQISFFDIEKNN